jgi:PAX-interacting protein 1
MGCVFWEAEPLSIPKSDWSNVVYRYGGDVADEYSPAIVTHVLCKTQLFKEFLQVIREGKRVVTLHWLNDIVVRKMLLPPYYAIHLPVPFRESEDPPE